MIRKPLSRLLGLTSLCLFAGSLGGCAGSAEFNPVGQNSKAMSPPQLAAWAARAEYPSNTQPGGELKMAAIVDPGDKSLKVYNFTGQPVRDSRLWVNKAFVAKIDGIPAQSKAEVKFDRLYDGMGNTFTSHKTDVSLAQIELDGRIYDLLGPATE